MACMDTAVGLRLWHQARRPAHGRAVSPAQPQQYPASAALCPRPHLTYCPEASGCSARSTWHRQRTVQHIRHSVQCGFSPFGRDIFGLSSSKQPDITSQQQLASDNQTAVAVGQGSSVAAELTPYSLFAAIFMDRVYKEPDNPAFQQLATEHASKLSLVCGLWNCLQPEQQVLFYHTFTPLCITLNQQQAARSGQPLRGLLQRIYTHLNSLPAAHRDAVNSLLTSAMQQRLLLMQTAVSASQGTLQDNALPSDVTSSTAAGAMGSLTHAVGGQEAGASLQDWLHQIHQDECNIGALRTALEAAGFGHILWQTGDLNGAMSITSQSEVRVMDRKVALGAAPSDVRLVTHLRAPTQQEFWQEFVTKCRLAWDVFFPPSQVLTPANAMRARLQMILVSDRSGLDLPTLIRIRNQSMAALAESNGWDNLSELELQVASTKASGEQVKLALPLTSMPERFMLRNADDYDYELYDDDDYEDDNDGTKVGEIIEGHAVLGGPSMTTITVPSAVQPIASLGPASSSTNA